MNRDYFLDITSFVCPMTFVRTTLYLESVPPGSEVTVRLNAGEPLENVPDAVREHGHEVIDLSPEAGDEAGVHLLRVRKRGDAQSS